MALVKLACTSCGAPLEERDGMFVCAHCGATYIGICDPREGFDAGGMSPEEFERKLAGYGELFVLKSEDGVELFDTDAELAASALRFAEGKLAEGDFAEAAKAAEGMAENSFRAARVCLLSAVGARNEAELSAYSGDIASLPQFERVAALADERIRGTYLRLAEVCAANAEASRKIEKGMGFVLAQDAESAKVYADRMLRSYPAHSEAWELYIAAKCLSDAAYDPSSDLEFLKKCPDYKYVYAPDTFRARSFTPVVAERFAAFEGKRTARAAFIRRYIVTPLAALAAVGVGMGVWKLFEALS